MPAYDYNLGNNNTQTYQQTFGGQGRGGAYSQFNYQNPQSQQNLGALQAANRGGYRGLNSYGGQNLGGQMFQQQTYGGLPQGQQAPGPQTQLPNTPGNYANPQSPYPGFSNHPYPGETGTQANLRMQQEYNAMGQRALPDSWDAQRRFNYGGQPGGGVISPPNTAWGGGGAGGDGFFSALDRAKLDRNREIMLQGTSDQKQAYASPSAMEIQGQYRGRMLGQNDPFNALRDAQLGQNAEANRAASQRDMRYNNQIGAAGGRGGGAGVGQANRDTARQYGHRTLEGRRGIQTQNAVLSDQRSERGLEGAAANQRERIRNSFDTLNLERQMRGRYEILGERPDQINIGSGAGSTGGGFQQYAQPQFSGGISRTGGGLGTGIQQGSSGGRAPTITNPYNYNEAMDPIVNNPTYRPPPTQANDFGLGFPLFPQYPGSNQPPGPWA